MDTKRWRFMQSSRFEYFYYFLALSLLAAFTVGGGLYYWSSKLLWKEAVQNSGNTLQLLKNGQELVLAEVNKAMESVFLDSSFLDYADPDHSSSVFERLQFQQRLDRAVLASDYIHSVYMYYPGPQTVLSSIAGTVALSGFQDRAFAESLPGETIDRELVRTRTLPGISSAGEETVVSVVKTLPIISRGRPVAYVVINIKGDYLVKIMQSLNTNASAHIRITDEQGNILSQKTSTPSLSFGEATGSFDISRLDGPSGWLFAKVNGVESLVCFVTSETSGWKYIYTIPKSVVTQTLSLWSKTTIVIGLLAVLLSLAGSVLLSRRVFTPLKRLLFQLRGAAESGSVRAPHEGGKEMTQIERNVGRLIDQNRDLSMLLKDYEIQSRNKFLLRLASGSEQVTPQTLERLAYYGVHIGSGGHFAIAMISMDDFSRFSQQTHESERNALLMTLYERVREEAFAKQPFRGYLVETETSEMVLVLYLEQAAADPETVNGMLHTWFRSLHDTLQSAYGMTFTIGVSTVRERLSELCECYLEAESAVRQRLVYGFNNVIYYESVRTEKGAALYPLGIEKQVLTQFKMGNREGVAQGLRDFEAYMLEHHAGQIEVVRQYFVQLFSSSLRCVYEIDANLGQQPDIRQLRHTDLLELETMRRMVGYVQALFDRVLDYLEQKRSLKNKELAAGVTAYIDEHLGDDLSVERLSDAFVISTSHLRKIFKEETGMTIKDMIGGKRIAKAKELLGDPHRKIQDIAVEVGYLTVQSFTKAFKMETGKTPGEYREHVLRGSAQDQP